MIETALKCRSNTDCTLESFFFSYNLTMIRYFLKYRYTCMYRNNEKDDLSKMPEHEGDQQLAFSRSRRRSREPVIRWKMWQTFQIYNSGLKIDKRDSKKVRFRLLNFEFSN